VIVNVCMKINSKLGGINHVLSKVCRPKLLKRPVMIMSADVSHPALRVQGVQAQHRCCGCQCSVELKEVNYEVQVRIQDMGLESNEEVIKDMKNVTRNLLRKFYEKNHGRKPVKIVMFRDGCSEGQFLTGLAKELLAMREACMELDEDYQPPIWWSRRGITQDFSPRTPSTGMATHWLAPWRTRGATTSRRGTSACCPKVLWDDNNFTVDELEVLASATCIVQQML